MLVGGGVYVLVCARAHQTPTCTPIILDGLAVKCVMWGSTSVFAAARCRVGMIVLGVA